MLIILDCRRFPIAVSKFKVILGDRCVLPTPWVARQSAAFWHSCIPMAIDWWSAGSKLGFTQMFMLILIIAVYGSLGMAQHKQTPDFKARRGLRCPRSHAFILHPKCVIPCIQTNYIYIYIYTYTSRSLSVL